MILFSQIVFSSPVNQVDQKWLANVFRLLKTMTVLPLELLTLSYSLGFDGAEMLASALDHML